MPSAATTARHSVLLSSEAETSRFAAVLAPMLRAGDTILLSGDLGAGKTYLARGIIQTRLAAAGRHEDVPSPTYTLVQTYDDGAHEIWHCDLYRVSDAQELLELGLDEAFATQICLIEWPDRLGDLAPEGALRIQMSMTETQGERLLTMLAPGERWRQILQDSVGAAFDA